MSYFSPKSGFQVKFEEMKTSDHPGAISQYLQKFAVIEFWLSFYTLPHISPTSIVFVNWLMY